MGIASIHSLRFSLEHLSLPLPQSPLPYLFFLWIFEKLCYVGHDGLQFVRHWECRKGLAHLTLVFLYGFCKICRNHTSLGHTIKKSHLWTHCKLFKSLCSASSSAPNLKIRLKAPSNTHSSCVVLKLTTSSLYSQASTNLLGAEQI